MSYWDKLAPNYDTIYGFDTKAGNDKLWHKAKLIWEEIYRYEGANILEIGCGNGNVTKILSDCFRHTKHHAIDSSQNMIIEASKKLCSSVSIQCANAEKLPYGDKSFHVVYGTYILMYTDLEKSLSETYRVLKTGGKAIFIEINRLNPVSFIRTTQPFQKWLNVVDNAQSFTKWNIKKEFARAGFKDVKVTPFEFEWNIPLGPINQVLEHTPIVKEFAGSYFITARKA